MKICWVLDFIGAVVLKTVHEQKKKDFVTLFLHVPVKKNQTNQTPNNLYL